MRPSTTHLVRIPAGVATLAILLGAGAMLAGVGEDPNLLADAPLLRYEVGSIQTWETQWRDTRTRLEVEPLSPLHVTGADLRPVLGLPFQWHQDGSLAEGAVFSVTDIEHGGLAVVAHACALRAEFPCPNDEAVWVSWQACPFMTHPAGPLDILPKDQFLRDQVVVEDPVKQTTWTYQSQRDGNLFRYDHLATSEPRSLCLLDRSITIDMSQGAIVERWSRDTRQVLLDTTPGNGQIVHVGGGPAQASRLLPPTTPREGPYPPGAEERGPDAWTLGEAWEYASQESDEVRRFLAEHPEGFLIQANNASGIGRIIGIGERFPRHHWDWDLLLLSPDREALEIEVRKESFLGRDTKTVEARPGVVPEWVPSKFRPPAPAAVDVRDFVAAMAAHGLRPTANFPEPSFGVAFDGEDADYEYFLVVGDRVTPEGIGISTNYVALNADTGRLFQALVPRDVAWAWLHLDPEAPP